MSWVTPWISSFVLICLTEASHFRIYFSSSCYQLFILKDYLSKATISSMTGFVSLQQEDRLIYCLFSLPWQSVSSSAESDIGSFLPYIPVMSHWNLLVRCLCVLFHSSRVTGVKKKFQHLVWQHYKLTNGLKVRILAMEETLMRIFMNRIEKYW